MKQQDIAILIVVAALSGIVAFVGSNKVFSAAHHTQNVPVVPNITAAFNQPDTKYFNPKYVDPTQNIQIGPGSNQAPFGKSSNQ